MTSTVDVESTFAKRRRQLREYVGELWSRRELAYALGMGNLKARNAATSLGIVWWVLNPLLLGGVYYVVFGFFFPGERDLGYLLSGMFAMHFTGQSLSSGANSILGNSKLLVNVRFPRLILPISALVENTVGFIFSLGVLIIITVPGGWATLTYRVLFFPLILVFHLIFNLGLSAAAGRLAVPFRDINNLIPYLNRIWLYATPIIWPLSRLGDMPEWAQTLVRSNPMYHFVSVYRSAFLGQPFDMGSVVAMGINALVIGIVGVGLFIKAEGRLVRYL